MNDLINVYTIKVLYKDHEFSLIPSNVLSLPIKLEMVRYVQEIGDIAFIVDDEMYFDEGALFNLTMKYCDRYIFI